MISILFLMDTYSCYDAAGASFAVREMYTQLSESYNIFLVCGKVILHEDTTKTVDYKIVSPSLIPDYIKQNGIHIIHYFKSGGIQYFSDVVDALNSNNLRIPIVITICQKPSYKALELTPKEIVSSDRIVFIDNASYNDSYYSFIPKKIKERIYFGFTQDQLNIVNKFYNSSKSDHSKITFGRGSSLNKCHKSLISTFDRIPVQDKEFVIIGGHICSPWLKDLINGRKDVVWKSSMSYSAWIQECSNFDIFLYQLPENAYSSIDGTLGDAMLLGIPPIVYGPEAIKERIKHGINGFIADTVDDIVKYSALLSRDAELRNMVGRTARETTLTMFPFSKTLKAYQDIYKELLLTSYRKEPIVLPLEFYCFYYRRRIQRWFDNLYVRLKRLFN